jgi:hypothetical protein
VIDSRIGRDLGCDHGHYLPDGAQWRNVAGYVSRCFSGAVHSWP